MKLSINKLIDLFITFFFSLFPPSLNLRNAGLIKEGTGVHLSLKKLVRPFHSIHINGSFDIMLKKGEEYSVKIETDHNHHDNIAVKVVDGVLSFHTFNAIKNANGIKVIITCDNISDLKVNGSTHLVSYGNPFAETLKVIASGAAQMNLMVKLKSLELLMKGICKLHLAGKVDEVNGDVTGASNLQALTLVAQKMNINADGASKCYVRYNQNAKLATSGVAKIAKIKSVA